MPDKIYFILLFCEANMPIGKSGNRERDIRKEGGKIIHQTTN